MHQTSAPTHSSGVRSKPCHKTDLPPECVAFIPKVRREGSAAGTVMHIHIELQEVPGDHLVERHSVRERNVIAPYAN